MYSPVLSNSWIPYMLRQGNNTRKRPVPTGASEGRARKRQKVSSNRYVAAPVAVASNISMRAPNINSVRDGRIRVRHREFVGSVTGTAAFAVTSYSVNPGVSTTFPWLYQMAALYESYKVHNLSFHYEPVVGTSTAGAIYMVSDYDSADVPPASLSEMMSFQGAVRSPVWMADQKYDLSSQNSQALGVQRYIRDLSLVLVNLDIKTYDVANFLIATAGGPGTAVGELYVDYDIELITPQLGQAGVGARYLKIVASGTVDASNPFGSTSTITGGLNITKTSSTTLTFNQIGTYRLLFKGTGNSVVLTNNGGTATCVNVVNQAANSQEPTQISIYVSAVGQTFIAASLTSLSASTTRILYDTMPFGSF